MPNAWNNLKQKTEYELIILSSEFSSSSVTARFLAIIPSVCLLWISSIFSMSMRCQPEVIWLTSLHVNNISDM